MNAKWKGKGKGKGKGKAKFAVLILILATHFPTTVLGQAACPISLLDTLSDLTEPCCQATPDGVCGEAFPLVCPQSCAKGLVDLWDICDTTAHVLPNDYFHKFLIDKCLPPRCCLATHRFECPG